MTQLMTGEVMSMQKFVRDRCTKHGNDRVIILDGEQYYTNSRPHPLLIASNSGRVQLYSSVRYESKTVFLECQLPIVELIELMQSYHRASMTQVQSKVKTLDLELRDTKIALAEERTAYTKLSERVKSLELNIGDAKLALARDDEVGVICPHTQVTDDVYAGCEELDAMMNGV